MFPELFFTVRWVEHKATTDEPGNAIWDHGVVKAYRKTADDPGGFFREVVPTMVLPEEGDEVRVVFEKAGTHIGVLIAASNCPQTHPCSPP